MPDPRRRAKALDAVAPTDDLPNGDPVLATRLQPPEAPEAFLPRDRLVRQLDDAVHLPVTLVNGPAGAGKTLLVADWLRRGRHPGPVGWLTLEAGDNLPGNFWAYVRETLRRVLPGMPADIGVPAKAEHIEPSVLVRLAAWINRQPEPVVLVLDEFEHSDELVVAGQLHDLVRHTAGQLRLVLISRDEPLLPLHRYRLAGQLAEIRATDLAMRLSETAHMLDLQGLHLSRSAVEAVHHRLSGWTAGLRLLAIAAQDADDADAYLKQIDVEQSALSDFLLTEVLHSQPAARQDLLLRCSILTRIHPELADALTGRRDGHPMLAELHRANTFTEALPDGWYRLHPMFAGILRLHLQATTTDQVEDLHLRAAKWLADHDQFRAARDHAVEAGAWGLAAQLLVSQFAIGQLLTGRDAARLQAQFSRMPPSVVSPEAELVRAAMHLARDDVDAALQVLDRVEEDRSPTPETPDACLRMASAFLRAGAGRLLGSVSIAATAARQAHSLEHAALAEPLAQHPELLTQVDAELGSVLLWQGRLSDAGRALEAAAQAPLTPTTAQLRHESQCRLALIDYLRGWPGRAERRIHHADEEAEHFSVPPETRTQVRDLVLAATALERDEVGAVQAALARASAPDSPGPDPVVALGTSAIRAALHVAQGNPDVALEELAQARRDDLADHPSDWGRERLAVTASAAHLAAGRPEAAMAALTEVPRNAPDSMMAEARARLAVDPDDERAMAQLQALRRDPCLGSATRTRALLLLGQAGSSRSDASCERLLVQALATAKGERLRRPFCESAGWVRRQLRMHPQLAQAHPWLPSDLCPPESPCSDAGGAAPLTKPLTRRERAVLARVCRMMSTEEIAEDLFVSPNTVKTHLKSINRKLGTTSRREAAQRADRLHLLDPG
ncbi:LuxR C-terminal-related transcriptional regulator [Streptacidiphilus fuscans]|uniref:Helix-turn-helix transcriptional regulator n=1 Tax=Streptacidiphilus fuscans TaxID=2789292 RepID=A0A931B1K5_9ACTN|nr:LuxR C-terminal-related transcriptional regulator [Streptacidiphilus fuscans]MBF9068563.1 helix-turn-helix transcriptional regulator [Streptacidiphilus fuscans]